VVAASGDAVEEEGAVGEDVVLRPRLDAFAEGDAEERLGRLGREGAVRADRERRPPLCGALAGVAARQRGRVDKLRLMTGQSRLEFIQRCVRERRILWTYHVNMRLERRRITRDEILDAVDTYTIVEAYPEDKYLPSYLVLAAETFHVLFAVDVENDHVRVVTAYRPDLGEWQPGFRMRRS